MKWVSSPGSRPRIAEDKEAGDREGGTCSSPFFKLGGAVDCREHRQGPGNKAAPPTPWAPGPIILSSSNVQRTAAPAQTRPAPHPAACPREGKTDQSAGRPGNGGAGGVAQAPSCPLTSLVARYGPGPTMRCSMVRERRRGPRQAYLHEHSELQFESRAPVRRALIGRRCGT